MSANHLHLGLAALIGGIAIVSELSSVRAGGAPAPADDGVIKVRSAYPLGETVERLEADIRGKGLTFFSLLDQAKLASDAGVKVRPSTLLSFGNPALGAQFLTSNQAAGLDWPVRMLVVEDDNGAVWAEYTDFAWIARRHRIADRDAAFQMASTVAASIAASVQAKGQ